jgi:hypothetical protein
MRQTVQCPAWCVESHVGERPEDVFHRSAIASIVPPAGIGATEPEGAFVELLTAELAVADEFEETPVILINYLGYGMTGVDLDLAGADEMLAELDRYRAAFKALRDRLAEASGR